MELQVGKWGDGLAVKLPPGLVRQMGLEEGRNLSLHELAHYLLTAGKELSEKIMPPNTSPFVQSSASSQPADEIPDREDIIRELEALHRNMPMGRSVIRFMRDQGY